MSFNKFFVRAVITDINLVKKDFFLLFKTRRTYLFILSPTTLLDSLSKREHDLELDVASESKDDPKTIPGFVRILRKILRGRIVLS